MPDRYDRGIISLGALDGRLSSSRISPKKNETNTGFWMGLHGHLLSLKWLVNRSTAPRLPHERSQACGYVT